ncbi:SHOCT domain-containing protein [Alicyclobacillus sp. SO9]|uniref:SHOCT domain-containing protein n=1 Tax=Alicyclobacillus sp. SO9 TaxID=2665646 RepID=UPI0018E75199|nr:SHOCT domain-containing protein [Alicyclobacillus sp. SO9]
MMFGGFFFIVIIATILYFSVLRHGGHSSWHHGYHNHHDGHHHDHGHYDNHHHSHYSSYRDNESHSSDDLITLLQQRYAKGEIDRETYQKMLKELKR